MVRSVTSLVRRWDAARSLVIGCAASLLVVGGGTGVSLVEIASAKADVSRLAGDAHREREMIGEVGRSIARARVQLEKVVPGQARKLDVEEAEAALERHAEHMEAAAAELKELLTTEEREPWRDLAPAFEAATVDFEVALEALRSGDMTAAWEVLDRIGPRAERIQSGLERLGELHRARVSRLLAKASDRLDRLWLLIAGLGGGALLGLTAVWAVLFSGAAQRRWMLDEHLRELHRVNADLEAFTGRVAHDLRNLLAPIAACPGLLSRPDPGMTARVSAQLERSCRRAERMLEALLAFSRGGKPAGTSSSSLAAALEEVVGDLGPAIAAGGVELHRELQDARVAMAPELLEVVLGNLLGNAVKFVAERDVRQVRVTALPSHNGVELRIADSGPGIPLTARSRIFEPFFRANPEGVKGSGIGLATVHRIVTGHGGTIGVDSTERGTVFTLWLPVSTRLDPDECAATVAEIESSTAGAAPPAVRESR